MIFEKNDILRRRVTLKQNESLQPSAFLIELFFFARDYLRIGVIDNASFLHWKLFIVLLQHRPRLTAAGFAIAETKDLSLLSVRKNYKFKQLRW